MKKNNIFSIPNIISFLRLLLLLPIFYLLSQEQKIFALVVILLSGFSDFLDGYIARKWNLQSDAGRIIDPVVDKINFVGLMLFLIISPRYTFPIWFFIIVVIRETMVLLFSFIIIEHKKKILESSIPGKISAFAIGMTLILFIFHIYPFMWIMLWLAIILTLYSTWIYFKRFIEHYKVNKNNKYIVNDSNKEMKV
ncbi:MAG: CDP-alcohol phosphatidyltransferase family protein [bacterium]